MRTSASPRLMAPADALWLRSDRDVNPLIIETVMWFPRPLAVERLVALLEARLVERYPVFRQRAVTPPFGLGLPFWEDVEDFDVRDRLVVTRLPRPGGQAELAQYVDTVMSSPLPLDEPLWQAHLVHGFGRGSALLLRFHHAVGDGVALVRVLLDLTDPPPGTGEADAVASGTARSGQAAKGKAAKGQAQDGAPAPSVSLAPFHTPADLGHVAFKLLLGHDDRTVLHSPPGPAKRAVWSRGRSLAKVKQVAHTCGATVNDVLVTALAGALSRYLDAHGGVVDHLTTLVPVNLRRPDEALPPTLGNKFALVFLPLPTGHLEPLVRLEQARHTMDAIKRSSEAGVTFGLMTAVGLTVNALERIAVDFFSGKGIGVTTNVAGPRTPRYLAGQRISGLLGWVPGAGGQTTGVCVVTYAGAVRVGFRLDASVPDPEALVAAFDAELDALEAAARDRREAGQDAARPTRPARANA